MVVKLVIVDDDEDDRYLAGRAVFDAGMNWEIIEFEAGDIFLNDFRLAGKSENFTDEEAVYVILLDINMPRMNGFEVLQKIESIQKSSDERIKAFLFVMFSSSVAAADQAHAMQYPFVRDYLTKPLTSDTVHQIAENFGITKDT